MASKQRILLDKILIFLIRILSLMDELSKRMETDHSFIMMVFHSDHITLKSQIALFLNSVALAESANVTGESNLFLNLTVEELTQFCESLKLISDGLIYLTNQDILDSKMLPVFFNSIHYTNPTFHIFFEIYSELK